MVEVLPHKSSEKPSLFDTISKAYDFFSKLSSHGLRIDREEFIKLQQKIIKEDPYLYKLEAGLRKEGKTLIKEDVPDPSIIASLVKVGYITLDGNENIIFAGKASKILINNSFEEKRRDLLQRMENYKGNLVNKSKILNDGISSIQKLLLNPSKLPKGKAVYSDFGPFSSQIDLKIAQKGLQVQADMIPEKIKQLSDLIESLKDESNSTENMSRIGEKAELINDFSYDLRANNMPYSEDELLKKYNLETETRRKLGSKYPEDKDFKIEVTKKYIGDFLEEKRGKEEYYAEHFARCFSKNPNDTKILYNFMSTPAGFVIGLGLEFADNFETFITNLEDILSEKVTIEAHLRPSLMEKVLIKKYVSLLRECPGLGIEHPFRFSQNETTTLNEIIQERLHHQIEKPLVTILIAKSDWNGAFNAVSEHVKVFLDQGYRVQYHEVATDQNLLTAITEATDNNKYPADVLMIAGHGSQKSISLSDEDPGSNMVLDSNKTLDLTDDKILLEASKYLKKDATIILSSCSTGKGERKEENMANYLRKMFPNAGPGKIHSPIAPGSIHRIEFQDGKVMNVKYISEDPVTRGRTTIPNYQP